jgi:polyisoprenoid-binding protein YceI
MAPNHVLALRMSGLVKYGLSPSIDSAIIVEILRTKLLRKHKYVLSFDDFKGELHYIKDHPEKSRFTLEIGAQSITCRDRRLGPNKQRRIAKYAQDFVLNRLTPSTIQFSSAQISAKALRGFAVEGTLTVGRAAKPLKMNVTFAASSEDLEIDGDFIFRFSAFDIKPPSSLLGMMKVGDEALVQFHIQAARTNTGTT